MTKISLKSGFSIQTRHAALVSAVVLSLCAGAVKAQVVTNAWKGGTNGTWSAVTNWTAGSAPNAIDTPVSFTNNPGGSIVVNLDTPATVGSIFCKSAQSETISNDTSVLTFDVSSGNALITVTNTTALALTIKNPIMLNKSLDVRASSANPTAATCVQLAGQIQTLDSSQSITKYGKYVLAVLADNSATYSNGWTLQEGGLRVGLAQALGSLYSGNVVRVRSGTTLYYDYGNAIFTSGPIRLDTNGNVYASTANAGFGNGAVGGGRSVTIPDIQLTSTGMVTLSYYGNSVQQRMLVGSVQLAGDTTLNVVSQNGNYANGGRIVIDANVNSVGSSQLGLVVPAGSTLTKTNTGTLELARAGTNILGTVIVHDGALIVDATNALGNGTGHIIAAGAALGLGTNLATTITQSPGSAERWYVSNARLAASGSDSYTLPTGVHLQLGGQGKAADITQAGSHTIRMTGGSIEPWFEQWNSAPQQAFKAVIIGQYQNYNLSSNTLGSATNITIAMDADLLVGNSGVVPGTDGVTPYSLNNKQLFITGPIVDGTAGRHLTKIGADTVVLSGTNTYSGNTTVSNGVLAVGRDHALPTNTLLRVVAGGYFDLDNQGSPLFRASNAVVAVQGNGFINSNHNQRVAGLIGNGVVTNSGPWPRAFTVNPNAGVTNSFSGSMGDTSGSLQLVKTGAGGQILASANSYGGGTTISNGNLTVGPVGTLGSGDVTVAGGTLRLENGSSIADAAALRLATGGKLDLAPLVNEHVGALTLNGTPLYVGTWGASGSGATHISDTLFSGSGIVTALSGPVEPPRVTTILVR